MSSPPPGWHPDPHLSPEPQPAEAAAGPPSVSSHSQPVFGASSQRTLTQRNSTTFAAIAVVALYLVLAASTGIVLIGIFPAMLAFRALQRREPLAVLAVAAAALAIVFSLTVLTRH